MKELVNDQLYTFNIDLKRQLHEANQIFVHLALAIIAPYIALYQYGDEGFKIGIEFGVIYFIVILAIHAFVHIRFYFVNGKNTLLYEPKTNVYSLICKESEVEFSEQSIASITKHVTRASGRRSLHYFPWNSYDYSEVILKNRQKLIITSLLLPKLKWPSEFNSLKEKKTVHGLFCWPELNRLN